MTIIKIDLLSDEDDLPANASSKIHRTHARISIYRITQIPRFRREHSENYAALERYFSIYLKLGPLSVKLI